MPTLFLSMIALGMGGGCVFVCGVVVVDGDDREAAGSRNGWIESEREREKREIDAAECACKRQGHPLGNVKL